MPGQLTTWDLPGIGSIARDNLLRALNAVPTGTVTVDAALGDGVRDASAAVTAALTTAGAGGTVVLPPGTYVLNEVQLTHDRQTLRGSGVGSTTILTATGADYAVGLLSKLECKVADLQFDGEGTKSGLLIQATNAVATSQSHKVEHVKFLECLIGLTVQGTTGTPPSDQVDKNTLEDVVFETCGTGLRIKSTNAQMAVVRGFAFNSCPIGVHLSNGELSLDGGGFQYNDNDQVGILLDGVNIDTLNLRNVWSEAGALLTGIKHIDAVSGATDGWPIDGVIAEHCTFVSGTIEMGLISGAGTVPVFTARHCRFALDCQVVTAIAEAVFNDEYCVFQDENGDPSTATWNTSGDADTTGHRHSKRYDGLFIYLGTALRGHVTQGGEYVANSSAHGLILKSANGHYWRVKVSDAGALSQTDLGTTMPTT